MKEIEAFESVDGTIFTDPDKAKRHDEDCIGEEFDALLLLAIQSTGGNVTRNDQYRMCLHLLKNRNEAKHIIAKLHDYLSNE